MKDLKEDLQFVYELLRPILIFFVVICVCAFFVFGSTYFLDKISSSQLEKIRYCPSCGVDLGRGC